MTNEFIPYEEALALKELGFDEKCISYYFSNGMFNDAAEEDYTLHPGDKRFYSDSNSLLNEYAEGELKYKAVSAPLYQQAFRWFFKTYGYHGEVIQTTDKYNISRDEYQYGICKTGEKPFYYNTYSNPEEAELACLRKLISLVKE